MRGGRIDLGAAPPAAEGVEDDADTEEDEAAAAVAETEVAEEPAAV